MNTNTFTQQLAMYAWLSNSAKLALAETYEQLTPDKQEKLAGMCTSMDDDYNKKVEPVFEEVSGLAKEAHQMAREASEAADHTSELQNLPDFS